MKTHVLLIDDDEDELKFITECLNQVNMAFKCTWARSGGQALKQLAYLKPDIIFLDLKMPGTDGFECLDVINQLPHLRDVPIVLHSSVMTDECREMGMKHGATVCLVKPLDAGEFTIVLQELKLGQITVS